jgi:hypothetical protein
MSIANGPEATGGAVPPWREFFRRRLTLPLQSLLRGGLAPRRLAWALAVGALLGSMPLAWGTTLLCLGAALLLRLNPLAVQIGNYAAWPLQIALALPYFQLGESWFGPVSPAAARADLLQSLVLASGAALGAWALSAPLLLALLYAMSRRLIATVDRNRPSGQDR